MGSAYIALFVLLVLSGFFSGAESALMSLSIIKVKTLAKESQTARVLLTLKENSKRLIITILIGNNIANIGASAIATMIAMEKFGSTGVGIATGVMTFFTLIFGEIIPKNFAIVHNQKISLLITRPIQALQWILIPVIFFFEIITNFCTKFISHKEVAMFDEEELKTLVEIGVSENALQEKEKFLIEGVLKFGDLTAGDTMTPRTKMFSLQQDRTIEDAFDEMIEMNYSRIPVYKEDKDNIEGIIYIRDILEEVIKGNKKTPLISIAKKHIAVHESQMISDILKTLQNKRTHIAVVTDEYGGTAGVITIEDIIEEITGDILDESDITPRLMKRVSKNELIVHGETEIDDINQFFQCDIEKPHHVNTITGFLQHETKASLVIHTTLDYKNLKIKVIEIDEDDHPSKIKITKNAKN